jgi:hypothetical protein
VKPSVVDTTFPNVATSAPPAVAPTTFVAEALVYPLRVVETVTVAVSLGNKLLTVIGRFVPFGVPTVTVTAGECGVDVATEDVKVNPAS